MDEHSTSSDEDVKLDEQLDEDLESQIKQTEKELENAETPDELNAYSGIDPKKMEELSRLHKKVVFIILVHSEVAFLANEGNAIEWIRQYNEIERVYPAFNSEQTFEQFTALGILCFYLPNIY
jgi:hypothetical protein